MTFATQLCEDLQALNPCMSDKCAFVCVCGARVWDALRSQHLCLHQPRWTTRLPALRLVLLLLCSLMGKHARVNRSRSYNIKPCLFTGGNPPPKFTQNKKRGVASGERARGAPCRSVVARNRAFALRPETLTYQFSNYFRENLPIPIPIRKYFE